jgi:hypothetical protein
MNKRTVGTNSDVENNHLKKVWEEMQRKKYTDEELNSVIQNYNKVISLLCDIQDVCYEGWVGKDSRTIDEDYPSHTEKLDFTHLSMGDFIHSLMAYRDHLEECFFPPKTLAEISPHLDEDLKEFEPFNEDDVDHDTIPDHDRCHEACSQCGDVIDGGQSYYFYTKHDQNYPEDEFGGGDLHFCHPSCVTVYYWNKEKRNAKQNNS